MHATYEQERNCVMWLDTFPDMPASCCIECTKIRTETVEILKFVSGLFGPRAIIKFDDGTVKDVPVNRLTLRR